MKVAIYARVSKALEQNPENQLIELRKYCQAAGHIIEGEYVDEISSKDTRPQKEMVLRKLRLSMIDGVAFYALDRWGRNMSELVLELEEFAMDKKSLISLKEGIDLSTAAGRMFANILAAMANFERERIRERTLLGLARARAQGKKLGRPTKDGKKYKKPSREAVSLYRESGMTIRDIAKELDTSKYWVEVVLSELKAKGLSVKVVQ